MPAAVRPSIAIPLAALVALVMVLVPTAAAHAHTDLRSSTPAEGATVADLDDVALQFTSPLLDIGAELSLVDGQGTTTALEPTFPAADTVAAAVDTDLAPGEAQLVWRVVAEDGHPIEGVVDFTLAPEADATSASPSAEPSTAPTSTPTPSATNSPTERPSEPTAQASAEPSPSMTSTTDAGNDSADPAWIWWVLAAVVIGGAATALAMVLRRRPTP